MSFKIKAMIPIMAIICALSAIAAPAALAHEFEAGQTKGIIQDKNVGNHVFETGGAKVECTKEESKGIDQVKKSEESKEIVTYSGCEAFGASAEVSQAKYDFKAEGTVTVENEVTVKAAGPKCEVKVPVAGNSNLGSVTYANQQQSGTMEIKAAVEGITSTVGGAGGLCPKGTNKTGKYKGVSIAWDLVCLPTFGGFFQDSQCWFFGPPQNYELYVFLSFIRWR